MSREHLFMGKRVDGGGWVEGSLINGVFFKAKDNRPSLRDIPYILNLDYIDYDSFEDLTDGYGYYEVAPLTVGEYTGKQDKNNKKIFEGNIVKIFLPCHGKSHIGVIRFGYYANANPFKTHLGFYIEWADKESINRMDFGFWIEAYKDEMEVIGNIHDNPELLEVKQ